MSPRDAAAPAPAVPVERASTVRRMLLALVLFGAAGLLLELLLLEHWDEPWQWVPLGLLGATLLSGAALWMRPRRSAVHAFRAVAALCVLTGVLGVGLHLRGNYLFELEIDDALGLPALLWMALRGATPTLAPGALAQIGLLGLILTYHHPALAAESAAARDRIL